MIKRSDILAIIKDRPAVLLLSLLIVGVVVVVLTTLIRVHPSDVQVPLRYSGYGLTNIYRDHWYILSIFPIFAILVTILNSMLAIKIHQLNRTIGLGILAMSVFIMVNLIVVANTIFNLAPTV